MVAQTDDRAYRAPPADQRPPLPDGTAVQYPYLRSVLAPEYATLLEQMNKTRVVRCDEAAWRFLGVSLAGYNVLVSLFLAAVAAWGALASWKAYGSSSVSQ